MATAPKTQAATTTVIIQNGPSNALGIASFIFGLISIFFLSMLFSPLSLLLGTIAVIKRQFVWGGIGIVCAFIGLMTSPIFLGILGASAHR
ncbi:conserved hypothetical protein [Rhodospirillaceae bacterium LM-1]|nr:conserved hypothetical protein [Rhodospirillaceae bacterium LM-1]